jgi:DNA-directed RNA polymerase specialized sigma24 family protein
MYSSKRSASSEASMYSDWTPRLLRFFQLIVGDPAAAERLTIETLVEGAAQVRVRLSNGMPAVLVHCAIKKADTVPEPTAKIQDALVRAVKSLPFSQRIVVVLFRGLGLPFQEVATVMGISMRQARRLCADGLLAIHDFLATADVKVDSIAGKQTGEFQ